jgi:Holliday junction resolvase RusA-like endonuclease
MSDDPPSTAHFLIYGEPASKANSRRWTGKLFIKSSKALAYSKAFLDQAKPLARLLEGDLRITVKIWYASRRPDLDASLIFDLLQGIAYQNDRQLREQHLYWSLDKENPRAEITIETIA